MRRDRSRGSARCPTRLWITSGMAAEVLDQNPVTVIILLLSSDLFQILGLPRPCQIVNYISECAAT